MTVESIFFNNYFYYLMNVLEIFVFSVVSVILVCKNEFDYDSQLRWFLFCCWV